MSYPPQWKLDPGTVLGAGPVIPVIVIDKTEHALPLAEALMEGGIRVLEVTLRTPAALEAISRISKALPDAIVGAGTVMNDEQLRQVREAGGMFAISPGLTVSLLDAAVKGDMALIPGVSSASELMQGLEYGLSYFKFFPAEAAGGVRMLKAIAGPFPQATFCPTGGIDLSNCRAYLALETVACVGGSWIVPQDAVAQGRWDRITELAREAAAIEA